MANLIDGLIDLRQLNIPASLAKAIISSAKIKGIPTKWGRAFDEKGYLACHYNVQKPGVGPRPICEIQIKTVIHDAWGAKTHDLTYKPNGQTAQELLESFELLGGMLANVDRQSDTLRDSIERSAAVRARKRAEVMLSSLEAAAFRSVANVEKHGRPKASALRLIVESIAESDLVSDPKVPAKIFEDLRSLFQNDPDATCMMMFFMAAKTRRLDHLRDAQEAIDAWIEDIADEVERLWAVGNAALAAFGAGDSAEAIDRAEDALLLFEAIDMETLEPATSNRTMRLGNSLLTSLAYYHADIIGSHEGKQRKSADAAITYLEKAKEFQGKIGLPRLGLNSDECEIIQALGDRSSGSRVFSTLDNEAFVRIQTACNLTELSFAMGRLTLIHTKKPSDEDPKGLLYSYHEYCARMRLAELESG